MPNYEYKCTREGTTFELWQEVGADAPPCPTCGAPSKKVFRPVRTIFKGSGFYLTDTRAEAGVGKSDDAPPPETPAPKPETPASTTETPAASETKTEAPKPA